MTKEGTDPGTHLLNVQGIDIYIDGEGSHTLVMIHGWPDTYRLWDSTAQALKGQYRCVHVVSVVYASPI